MVKYSLSKKAFQDLSTIWEYSYEVWSERQANKYYELLIVSIELIANNPSIGKSYSNIDVRLKGYKTNQHIIFYRIGKQGDIEIIRILHAQMDLKEQLKEP